MNPWCVSATRIILGGPEMRYARLLCTVSLALLAGGCSTDDAMLQPKTDAIPNDIATLLRLSNDRLMPGIDTAALRVLLERVPREARPLVRASFTRHPDWLLTPVATNGDSGLQRMIDAVTAPQRSVAQRASPAGPTRPADIWAAPVTVVLSEVQPATSSVTIERHAHSRDIIILGPSEANSTRLSETLRGLGRLRSQEGAIAEQDRTVHLMVRSNLKKPFTEPWSWTAYLDRKLDELRRAEPRHVPGVGMVRAIELHLLEP